MVQNSAGRTRNSRSVTSLSVFAHAPKDVFDIYDRVIDQFANGNRQTAQGHVLIDSPKAANTNPVITMDSGIAVSLMIVVRKFHNARRRVFLNIHLTERPMDRKNANETHYHLLVVISP